MKETIAKLILLMPGAKERAFLEGLQFMRPADVPHGLDPDWVEVQHHKEMRKTLTPDDFQFYEALTKMHGFREGLIYARALELKGVEYTNAVIKDRLALD